MPSGFPNDIIKLPAMIPQPASWHRQTDGQAYPVPKIYQEVLILRVAVVGSRELFITDLGPYLPPETTEIVTGGAKGVDTSAALYAVKHGLKLTEFRPDYRRYGKGAPLKRNITIIENADFVLIFWNGTSTGTQHVISECQKRDIPYQIYRTI